MSHFNFEHIREDTIEGSFTVNSIFDLEQIYLALSTSLLLIYIVIYFLSR